MTEVLFYHLQGKTEEAKKIWEEIKNEARPRPLEFSI